MYVGAGKRGIEATWDSRLSKAPGSCALEHVSRQITLPLLISPASLLTWQTQYLHVAVEERSHRHQRCVNHSMFRDISGAVFLLFIVFPAMNVWVGNMYSICLKSISGGKKKSSNWLMYLIHTLCLQSIVNHVWTLILTRRPNFHFNNVIYSTKILTWYEKSICLFLSSSFFSQTWCHVFKSFGT